MKKTVKIVNESQGEDGNTKSSLKVIKSKQVNTSKYWSFTWNNFPKSAPIDLKSQLSQNKNISKFVFQQEKGESGTPHIQGCVEFIKPNRYTNLGLPKEIHWERTRNRTAAIDYCQKSDTAIKDTIVSKGLPSKLIIIDKLKPWQSDIEKQLLSAPDNRTINWIYDPIGNTGKTVFCKYLTATQNAIGITAGNNKDIACLIANLKKAGRDLNMKTIFIFNIARSGKGISYKAIESIKDGYMTSVKYESETLCFNCPHVWVFANTLPDYNELTADRWKTWTIHDNNLIPYDTKIINIHKFKKLCCDDLELKIDDTAYGDECNE